MLTEKSEMCPKEYACELSEIQVGKLTIWLKSLEIEILLKCLGGSKVDSVFHPSEVDQMSSRNFWELSGKK